MNSTFDVSYKWGDYRSLRAFAAIRSSPVSMTGLSSLCIEGRNLPLNGAHVAQERFNFCWPLPHVVGSPDLGVLSASLTSAKSSGLPRLVSLSDDCTWINY